MLRKKHNECLHTLSGLRSCPPQRKTKGQTCSRNTGETCQATLLKEIRVVVCNGYKATKTERRQGFELAQLVIRRWHLSDKCCVLFPCPKQYTGGEHADTSIGLWMFPRWSTCPLPQKDFALSVSKYKLSISTTAIKNVLQCTEMRSRAGFFFFCLDFFRYTVNNKDRRRAL